MTVQRPFANLVNIASTLMMLALLAVVLKLPTYRQATYRPDRPETAYQSINLVIPQGEVIESNGDLSTLVTPEGRYYTISSLPRGHYTDIRLKRGMVISAEPALVKVDCTSVTVPLPKQYICR